MTETIELDPGSGISRQLAQARSASIQELKLALCLQVPRSRDGKLAGRAILDFTLEPGVSFPPLDFAPYRTDDIIRNAIGRLELNGEPVQFEIRDGHIVLPQTSSAGGPQQIEIEFETGADALSWREDLVYTLSVPANAHKLFPCFDQPDLKTSFELELIIPPDWTAVANGAELSREIDDEVLRLKFAPTDPLPSYLLAFAAGRLATIERDTGHRRLVMHLAEHNEPSESELDEIFGLHQASLELLESYTGIDYPFGKFGFVLIPDFDFAGMEHPGAVFYRQSLLLPPGGASDAERQRRANLIAHETAHMWFGNLLTMRWFDDVWLKEVFANFLADKLIDEHFPDIDHELGFVLRHYPPALAIDRTAGAHPIRQRLDNLAHAGELYDALVYHKAPVAMAELEKEIGAEALQRGLRDYLKRFSFGNADWPELLECLSAESDTDLHAWSERWIESSGAPQLRGPPKADRPTYAIHELTPAESETLLLGWRKSSQAAQRAVGWICLYQAMLDGGIVPAALLTAAVDALETESEPALRDRITDDLAEIFWRYLHSSQRSFAAGPVERVLRMQLAATSGSTDRLKRLRTLARFAVSTEALAWLEELLRNDDAFAGALPASMVAELVPAIALRRPERADGLFGLAYKLIEDPATTARLEFLRPAVSDDAEVREAMFRRLLTEDNRGLWAVEALALLNHPLRAEQAIGYLEPGMQQAIEIRDRGEIFLPGQWLKALFSGHASPEAAQTIRSFLEDRELPARIKQLILQTADPIFRAAKILA